MSDTMTDIHKGRYQGIAFALAEVSRLHDEPQFVVDVMSNTGLLFRKLNVTQVQPVFLWACPQKFGLCFKKD